MKPRVTGQRQGRGFDDAMHVFYFFSLNRSVKPGMAKISPLSSREVCPYIVNALVTVDILQAYEAHVRLPSPCHVFNIQSPCT